MPSKLEQLKTMTTVVADTGNFDEVKQFKPQDATTNPSLILRAAQKNEYQDLINNAITYAKDKGSACNKLHLATTKLMVNFGQSLLQVVPGYVSTEVDPRYSYDTESTIKEARHIIKLYEESGTSRDRILIKIASTWEGICAAQVLEKEGIKCNMTLIFCLEQAAACGEVGATLISPFVGRILDWYKAQTGKEYTAQDDPGVLSVKQIFNYLLGHQYKTIVMGASFRNQGEIEELAGCDRLTISPALLSSLDSDNDTLTQKLDGKNVDSDDIPPKIAFEKDAFTTAINNNPMAIDKLENGITLFSKDTLELENLLKARLEI